MQFITKWISKKIGIKSQRIAIINWNFIDNISKIIIMLIVWVWLHLNWALIVSFDNFLESI